MNVKGGNIDLMKQRDNVKLQNQRWVRLGVRTMENRLTVGIFPRLIILSALLLLVLITGLVVVVHKWRMHFSASTYNLLVNPTIWVNNLDLIGDPPPPRA